MRPYRLPYASVRLAPDLMIVGREFQTNAYHTRNDEQDTMRAKCDVDRG